MEVEPGVLNLTEVFKKTFVAWRQRFLQLTILFGVFVLFKELIFLFVKRLGFDESITRNLILFVIFTIGYIFIVLMALRFVDLSNKVTSFKEAFASARGTLGPYLKSFFLVFGFVFGLFLLALKFLQIGQTYYQSTGGCSNCDPAKYQMAVAVLLGMSTLCVVFLIASIWYFMYFSLAPLVAVLEKKGAWASLWFSKQRLKGTMFWYILMWFMFLAGVGVVIYFPVVSFRKDPVFASYFDPLIGVVLGPLIVGLWFNFYKAVTKKS